MRDFARKHDGIALLISKCSSPMVSFISPSSDQKRIARSRVSGAVGLFENDSSDIEPLSFLTRFAHDFAFFVSSTASTRLKIAALGKWSIIRSSLKSIETYFVGSLKTSFRHTFSIRQACSPPKHICFRRSAGSRRHLRPTRGFRKIASRDLGPHRRQRQTRQRDILAIKNFWLTTL